jgi:murein tripeptide amidase MpaA
MKNALRSLMFMGLAVLLFSSAFVMDRTEVVSVAKSAGRAAWLTSLGFDLLAEHDGRIFLVASPEDLARLADLRLPFRDETARLRAGHPAEPAPAGGINGDYHSYRELEAELTALAQNYPSLAKLSTIGRSLEGRNLYALKVSDNAALDEQEPAFLVVGCHHAREWISVEVPLLFARHLLEEYARNGEVQDIVNRGEIWVVPLLNPDGLEYSIHVYRYWRKNRRLNADGSFGIDLNRNYGYKWGYDDVGSSGTPASEVYRGTAPFSEPETDACQRFFRQHDFRALVSYHSYSQIILYPWGYIDAPTDKDAALAEMARTMAELMRPVNGRLYDFDRAAVGLYTTNGDTTDWAYAESGIPAFTIELPPVDILHGGFFNKETDILPLFRENLPALLFLAQTAFAAPSQESGNERDERTAAPPRRGGDRGKD